MRWPMDIYIYTRESGETGITWYNSSDVCIGMELWKNRSGQGGPNHTRCSLWSFGSIFGSRAHETYFSFWFLSCRETMMILLSRNAVELSGNWSGLSEIPEPKSDLPTWYRFSEKYSARLIVSARFAITSKISWVSLGLVHGLFFHFFFKNGIRYPSATKLRFRDGGWLTEKKEPRSPEKKSKKFHGPWIFEKRSMAHTKMDIPIFKIHFHSWPNPINTSDIGYGYVLVNFLVLMGHKERKSTPWAPQLIGLGRRQGRADMSPRKPGGKRRSQQKPQFFHGILMWKWIFHDISSSVQKVRLDSCHDFQVNLHCCKVNCQLFRPNVSIFDQINRRVPG